MQLDCNRIQMTLLPGVAVQWAVDAIESLVSEAKRTPERGVDHLPGDLVNQAAGALAWLSVEGARHPVTGLTIAETDARDWACLKNAAGTILKCVDAHGWPVRVLRELPVPAVPALPPATWN